MWDPVDLVQWLTGEMLMVVAMKGPVPIQVPGLVHSLLHNGGESTSRDSCVGLLYDDVVMMNDQDSVEFFLPVFYFIFSLDLENHVGQGHRT